MNPIVTAILVFWVSYVGAMFAGVIPYQLPIALILAGVSGISEFLGIRGRKA